MAAILLARKLARGELLQRGAMPCIGLITLGEFESEFRRWRISTLIRETPDLSAARASPPASLPRAAWLSTSMDCSVTIRSWSE